MQRPRRTWFIGASALVLAAATGMAMTLSAVDSNNENPSQRSDAKEKEAANKPGSIGSTTGTPIVAVLDADKAKCGAGTGKS